MRKSLSTSNSRPRLPWALVAAVGAFTVTNVAVSGLHAHGVLVSTSHRLTYEQRLIEAQRAHAYFLEIGNSVVYGVHPIAPAGNGQETDETRARSAHPVPHSDAFYLVLQGATPRTHLFILRHTGFRCIQPQGNALFFFTPADLNRYNGAFRATITSYFSWSEFFSELMPDQRLEELKYFVMNCGLPLSHYRYEVRRALRMEPDSRADDASTDAAVRQRWLEEFFGKDLFERYAVDPLELRAASEIIEGLKHRQVRVGIVLLPCSPTIRGPMGAQAVSMFVEAVSALAHRYSVPVLDYVSSYTGNEYTYTDGFHLTDASKATFNRILGQDAASLLRLNPATPADGVLATPSP